MRRTQVAIRLDPDLVEALDSAAQRARAPWTRASIARQMLRKACGLPEQPPKVNPSVGTEAAVHVVDVPAPRKVSAPTPNSPARPPTPPPPKRIPTPPVELSGVECPGCHWDIDECDNSHQLCVRRAPAPTEEVPPPW